MSQPVDYTQEDPIGLAGGMNLYGYAAGDPINNSDPFGLKVCFAGKKAEVAEMKAAMETATQTTFELNSDGCANSNSVKSTVAGGKFSELGERFFAMADQEDGEWSLIAWEFEGRAVGSRNFGTAMIGFGEQRNYQFATGPWGQCDGGTAAMGITGQVVHELLGHLWQARGGGSDKDEPYAVASENLFRALPGQGPQRCRY